MTDLLPTKYIWVVAWYNNRTVVYTASPTTRDYDEDVVCTTIIIYYYYYYTADDITVSGMYLQTYNSTLFLVSAVNTPVCSTRYYAIHWPLYDVS